CARKNRLKPRAVMVGYHSRCGRWKALLMMTPTSKLIPNVLPDERGDGLIRPLCRGGSSLIRYSENREIAHLRDPYDPKVHRVATRVAEHRPATPRTRRHSPSECVVAAKARRVKRFVGLRFEQGTCAMFAAQLVGDELCPVGNGTMYGSSGP